MVCIWISSRGISYLSEQGVYRLSSSNLRSLGIFRFRFNKKKMVHFQFEMRHEFIGIENKDITSENWLE